MKKVTILTNDLKRKMLKFLYCHEMYNAILIELIEKYPEGLGELFINEENEVITAILHIKNDGNSDFTNFIYTSEDGLINIAEQIRKLGYKKILLAGKLEDVASLLKTLGYEKPMVSNIFYKLNAEKFKRINLELHSNIRQAMLDDCDIEKVKEFTINFLEAETEEEIDSIGNSEKILAKIKAGVYLLEYQNKPIGMARFIGKTNRFAEITSVYIDKAYRKRGFGKELISHMINIAIQEQKTPVLEASSLNISAIKTYEAIGFEKQEEYAFEFID